MYYKILFYDHFVLGPKAQCQKTRAPNCLMLGGEGCLQRKIGLILFQFQNSVFLKKADSALGIWRLDTDPISYYFYDKILFLVSHNVFMIKNSVKANTLLTFYNVTLWV